MVDGLSTIFMLIGFYSTIAVFPRWIHNNIIASPPKSLEEYEEENDDLQYELEKLSDDYAGLEVAFNESYSKMIGISIGADKKIYSLVSSDDDAAYKQGYDYAKDSNFTFDSRFSHLEPWTFYEGFDLSRESTSFDVQNVGDLDSFIEGCKDGLIDCYHLNSMY